MRTHVTPEALRDMIRAEADRHAACEGVFISGVTSHEPDDDGCNWGLGAVRGGGDSLAAVSCIRSLEGVVETLRAKYNLDETE